MAMTLMSAVTITAAAENIGDITLGVNGISGGGINWVYYGNYSGTPTKWRVLSVSGGNAVSASYKNDNGDKVGGTYAMFLLSEYLLDDGQAFGSTSWPDSELKKCLNNFYNQPGAFSTIEKAQILTTHEMERQGTDVFDNAPLYNTCDLDDEKVFALSGAEVTNSKFGFGKFYDTTNSGRQACRRNDNIARTWWLRSPFTFNENYAGVVSYTGAIAYDRLTRPFSVRPAFNFNRSAVLFASAAEGGKLSGPCGAAALTSVSTAAPTEWKLTLLDSSRSFTANLQEGSSATVAAGADLSVDFSGANVGTDEYISAMIVDAGNNVRYYGRLVQPEGASGTANITIPTGLAKGSYTLKLFSEEYRGDKETDYASAFSDVRLTVYDNAAPAVTSVTPSGTDAAVSGNVQVTFDEAMDVTAGTISLNGGVTDLTIGSWSNGNTVYTVSYPDLSYSTRYTVMISGFKDTAGNVTDDNSSYSFTTCSAPSSSSAPSTSSTSSDPDNDYQLTFITNGGGEVSSIHSAESTDFDLSGYAPTRVGYTFTGWYTDPELTEKVTSMRLRKNTTIYAGWRWNNSFTDISETGWYYGGVEYVSENGLMNGTTADTFSPYSSLTRAMFVTVLKRLSGDTESYINTFSDVPTGKWYENAAAWAAKNGITAGVEGGRFGPNDNITRAQLAVMLYRYAQYMGYNISVGEDTNILSYTDAFDISDYAYSALQWACGTGILESDDSGRLNPHRQANRAEVSVILLRFVKSST